MSRGEQRIRITCPACGKALAMAAKLSGSRIRCPNAACGKMLSVRPSPSRGRHIAANLWLLIGGGTLGGIALVRIAVGGWFLFGGSAAETPPAVAPAAPANAVQAADLSSSTPAPAKPETALCRIDLNTGAIHTLDKTFPPLPPASITEGFSIGGIGGGPAPSERRTLDAVEFARNGRHALAYGTGTEIRVWRASEPTKP
jgi:hypothetical protein